MTGPIDTAYVEIKPETGGFTRNLRRDVDRAFSDVSRDVDRHTNKIRNSLSSAFGAIGGAIRGAATVAMLVTKMVALAGAAGAVAAALAGVASAAGGAVQGLIGLVQVAVQAAGALLLIPGALGILAATVATLKVGLSGVGAAFKEAGKAGGGASVNLEAAEHRIMLAQRAAKQAQEDLTRARKAAKENIEDLARALRGARLDEEGATLGLEDAAKALQAAQRSGDPEAIRRADLAYRQAQQTLDDVKDHVEDLAAESADANKKGVEGSDAVQAALQRQADATYELAQAQKAATASAGGMASAMSKLAPNAQEFVRAVLAMKPAFTDLRLAVQNALFKDLGSEFTKMARGQLPVLKKGLTDIAVELNTGIIAAFRELGSEASKADFASIFKSAATVIHNLAGAVRPLLQALRDIVTVSAGSVAALTGGLSGWAEKFAKKIHEMRASGELKALIDDGIVALKALGGLLKDILGIFSGLAKAAGGSDGLFGFFDKLNKLINSVQGQDTLTKLFASLGEIGATLLPVLGAVAAALVPVAKGIAAIAVAFAPTLIKLAGQLGDALASLAPAFIALAPAVASMGNALAPLAKILVGLVVAAAPGIKAFMDGLTAAFEALAPVAPIVGKALGDLLAIFGKLIAVIAPLLAPLLQFLAYVIQGLAAVIGPLLDVLGELFQEVAAALIPVFNELITTMLPLITQLGKDFAASFKPLIPIIVELAKSIGAKLLKHLPSMVEFFERLAPIILDVGEALAESFLAVLEAIAPDLPDIIDAFIDLEEAFREIVIAILPLIPQLIKLAAKLIPIFYNTDLIIPLIQGTTLALQLFAQILTIVIPIIEKVIGFLSGAVTVFRNLASPVSAITGALSTVGGAFGIFGKKTKDGMGVAQTAVVTSVGTIKGKLSPLGAFGESVGKAVGQGVSDGMKKKQHAVEVAAAAIAALIAGVVSAALRLGSPSKLFMEMGQDTVEGYIIGLKKAAPHLKANVNELISNDVTQVAGSTNIDQSINFGANAINMKFGGEANPQVAAAAGMAAGRGLSSELARRRDIRVAVRTA